MKQKLLIITGPTASGKTALAVKLAKERNGEVISADSRQVYRGLDIGTGKVTKREMRRVPHHCLDIASPRRAFTAAQWVHCAEKAIRDISSRGKLPIIAGGTGFYIDALIGRASLPEVPPNPKLRGKLDKLSNEKLFTRLNKLDKKRAADISKKNEFNNRRRLIRAIEIATALGKVPRINASSRNYNLDYNLNYNIEWIHLDPSEEELAKKIEKRLDERLRRGMVAEVRRLRESGLSWKRLNELGLEYREIARFLRGEITKVELRETLLRKILQYAKRQKRWFRR
jgi:tRNA dimethylallyltransferase